MRSVQANARGNRPSLAAARDTSVVTSVQPFSAPMPETTASAATSLPAQAPWVKIVSKAFTNGAVLSTSAWCGTRPMTAAVTSRYRMALARGAEQRGAADVPARVLDPLGGDRRDLDADEGEQGHAGGDADRAVQAAAGGVERRRSSPLDTKNQPDDADEQQRQELQHHGDVLEPGHLPDPGQVHRRRHPQADQGDAPVGHARRVAEAEQGVDVEHPRGHDGGVTGPGLRSSSTSRSGSRRSRRTRAGRRRTARRRSSGPAWSAGRTATASSMAPTAMTARTSSELVPAPASTAGIVKTPVPMMLPMTRPVAEVRPSARAFCCARVGAGS